jgi:hypothetical protein
MYKWPVVVFGVGGNKVGDIIVVGVSGNQPGDILFFDSKYVVFFFAEV